MAAMTNAEADEICSPKPDPCTKKYLFQHSMYRVKDPRKSIAFYSEVLGMRLLMKCDHVGLKFSLYVMGHENDEDIPQDPDERVRWARSRKGTVELAHNWGTETDDSEYHNGNTDPRGFSHIGVIVPDLYAACERFESLGVEFEKKPDEGDLKGLAVIKDPDGYWIELMAPPTGVCWKE